MSNLSKNFLIYGVSKGLGKAIIQSIPESHDVIYGISRSIPISMANLNWIEADLSSSETSVYQIKEIINDNKIDVLIYNVGIWETNAFTDEYDFEKISPLEINQMISTNITTCIQSLQALLKNLRASNNAKVILIGSTWGVENHNGKELIFSATKFALRGVAESLKEILRNDLIGVSILNLGYLATEYEIDTAIDKVLKETDYSLIPLADVIHAIKFIMSTSKGTCVKEILMPAMKDINV
ncbi:SDR family NAD(P)-dependent oxidoreductase [Acinetobacter sp. TY2]|uniref:SDR family NAD(P)-dependent oxidoreductase n=1 Tax=Acinetobacter sp. TY2 TaxID=3387403 RepID=UPI0039178542